MAILASFRGKINPIYMKWKNVRKQITTSRNFFLPFTCLDDLASQFSYEWWTLLFYWSFYSFPLGLQGPWDGREERCGPRRQAGRRSVRLQISVSCAIIFVISPPDGATFVVFCTSAALHILMISPLFMLIVFATLVYYIFKGVISAREKVWLQLQWLHFVSALEIFWKDLRIKKINE